jgi:hypothetical protein
MLGAQALKPVAADEQVPARADDSPLGHGPASHGSVEGAQPALAPLLTAGSADRA